MPSLQRSHSTTVNIDHRQWISLIKTCMEENANVDGPNNYNQENLTISIFNIPNFLIAHKPEVYIPQLVSLGPYHHLRSELYDMERYKLSAAKKIRDRIQSSSDKDFHHLVRRIGSMENRIRCSYQRYLDHDAETLAWMMAVDTCFLIDFLHLHEVVEGEMARAHVSCNFSKSVRNAVLRDVMMLENQIPLFLIRVVVEESINSPEMAIEMQCAMLTKLCKEIMPFKGMEVKIGELELAERAHLLDLLYHTVISSKFKEVVIEIFENQEDGPTYVQGDGNGDVGRWIKIKKWSILILGKFGRSFMLHLIKRLIHSKLFLTIIRIPWNIVFSLPILSLLKEPIEYLIFNKDKNEDNDQSNNEEEDSPLIEEIWIPSVTELHAAGVTFKPTKNAELISISFDKNTATLYLPTVNLNENTEVVIRNLVAYEALSVSRPLILARYTELMNGIIDSEEDVRLMREKGVLLNRLKSDREVADVWNEMSKSVRLTKVPFLDRVIDDINKYYEGNWKVKVKKMTKKYAFKFWRPLALVSVVVFLLMSALEAFCSVHDCAPINKAQIYGQTNSSKV